MLQDNLQPNNDTLLPYDVVTLPSQGIFTNGKKTEKETYLNASDENLLSSQALLSTGKLVDSLIDRKVLDKDITAIQLPACDKEAILIFLRNTAFGSEYEVELVDKKTKEPFRTKLDLSVLRTKDIGVKLDTNMEFEFMLEKSNKKAKLSFISPQDEQKLTEIDAQYKNDPQTPYMTKQLEMMVKEIDGVRDRMTIAQFIQTMPIRDAQEIRKVIRDNTPSLDLNIPTTTPSGEEMNVKISLGVEFFRPFYGI